MRHFCVTITTSSQSTAIMRFLNSSGMSSDDGGHVQLLPLLQSNRTGGRFFVTMFRLLLLYLEIGVAVTFLQVTPAITLGFYNKLMIFLLGLATGDFLSLSSFSSSYF